MEIPVNEQIKEIMADVQWRKEQMQNPVDLGGIGAEESSKRARQYAVLNTQLELCAAYAKANDL